MKLKLRPFVFLLAINFICAPLLRAQDDPDMKKMMKEAEDMQKEADELQKQNPPSPESKKKFAEMVAEQKQDEERQAQEEKHQKEKLQAALKKQLEAPGAIAFPDWMPATPQFKVTGSPTKKIEDDQVKIMQTGTSPLSPKELADAWEAAAVAAGNLNHSRNNNTINARVSTVMFLTTRTAPFQEVRMEAEREGGKVTKIEISSTLPKPNIDSDQSN